MLVERADWTITICEMRYAGENEYGFTQESKARLHRCGRLFREATGVKKAIAYALVTTVAHKRWRISLSIIMAKIKLRLR